MRVKPSIKDFPITVCVHVSQVLEYLENTSFLNKVL